MKKLPLAEFAQSLGLPSTPKIRFLSKQAKTRGEEASMADREDDENEEEEEKQREPQQVQSEGPHGQAGEEEEDEEEEGVDGFLRVKRLNHDLQAEEHTDVVPSRCCAVSVLCCPCAVRWQVESQQAGCVLCRSRRKRLRIREGSNTLGTKKVFDDSGNALLPLEAMARLSQPAEGTPECCCLLSLPARHA